MRAVELRRSAADRRLFEIEGVGWLRGASWLSQRSEAGTGPSPAAEWAFEPRGWTGGGAEAIDLRTGMAIGGYRRTATLSRTGEVTWGGRVHTLRPTSSWRQRYELGLDGSGVVTMHVKGYGRTPASLGLAPGVPPGLVLFTCWLGRLFVGQDSAAAT